MSKGLRIKEEINKKNSEKRCGALLQQAQFLAITRLTTAFCGDEGLFQVGFKNVDDLIKIFLTIMSMLICLVRLA
jgi:hypothetical protein